MSTKVNQPKDDDKAISQIDPVGLYKFKTFQGVIDFSRAYWWRLVDRGDAPQSAFKDGNIRMWRGADILVWLEDPKTYKERVAAGDTSYPTLQRFIGEAARLAA